MIHHGSTQHLGYGIGAAAVGILGNQLVARYKLVVGRKIQSATMIADAKHSWLDALSSVGAMLGLIGVAFGWSWADAVAGLVITGFICHVGWEVSKDIAHRLPESTVTVPRSRADGRSWSTPPPERSRAPSVTQTNSISRPRWAAPCRPTDGEECGGLPSEPPHIPYHGAAQSISTPSIRNRPTCNGVCGLARLVMNPPR